MKLNNRNPLFKLVSRKATGKPSKSDDDTVSLSSSRTLSSYDAAGSGRSLLKNTVCFDESQNMHHEPSHDDGCCAVEELWYSNEDCKQMKQQHVASCKSVCRVASRGSESPATDSYAAVLTRIYEEACCDSRLVQELDGASQQELNELFQRYSASQTGMEQKILDLARKTKRSRRHQLVELAYNLPQQQQDERIRTHQQPHTSDELAEIMRAQCRTITRPARLFAVGVARALEHSLIKEEQ